MATPLPRNHARFSLDQVAQVTGGVLVGDPSVAVDGVSTDTRSLAAGALFVAIRGATHDGHDHLAAAKAAGAAAVLMEADHPSTEGMAAVRVRSTLEALGELARDHTRRWRSGGSDRRLVAITGSAGKTTTRIATEALLERVAPGRVHASTGNLNNRIGVPMVVLGLEERHRFAVIELGTNAAGEIAALAHVVSPDVAVVTLVASAHALGLGSLEQIAVEKGSLFASLGPSGIAIGNGDDERVTSRLLAAPCASKRTYGTGPALDLRLVSREAVGFDRSRIVIQRRSDERLQFETTLLGEAGALACAAAILAVESMTGVPVDSAIAHDAFSGVRPGAGEGRLVPRLLDDDVLVLDDSYNSNPASSCASIRAASEIARATSRRLILVLGEMRELGPAAEAGHRDVGEAAAKSGARQVIAVVGQARIIADAVRSSGVRAMFAPDLGEAERAVMAEVMPGDLVLVKGSRGVSTDAIVRALERRAREQRSSSSEGEGARKP